MTERQAVDKLLAWAEQQLGYHEGANNYNKYAEDTRLQQLYGWNAQNQPWCDLFTDAAFITCFGLEKGAAMTYQPVGGGSAACRVSAGFFRNHGAFTQAPQRGDVIFFYVSGDINHQGLVYRVTGNAVETIEGNSSDSVARRSYALGSGNIAGYGRPLWSLVAEPEEEPEEESEEEPEAEPEAVIELQPVGMPVLRNGDCGAAVAALQAALKHLGYDPVWIDGEFGDRTHNALKTYQSEFDLADELGTCGPLTWAELMKG